MGVIRILLAISVVIAHSTPLFGLSFVGGRTRLEAMVGDVCILASRVSARDESAIQPGQRVRLAWSQANSVVLD